MSESGAAVANRGVDAEDDCPLCLEPLPPFWDTGRRTLLICCGGSMCGSCQDRRDAVVHGARTSGSFGRQEEQLASTCPLCRTPLPKSDHDEQTRMMESFEKGQLPLNLYRELALRYLNEGAGMERNVERGIEILVLGANKDDPHCQYLIGCRYEEGKDGLPKSTAEAKRWWFAAAKQGHAIAEFNLALTLMNEGNHAEYLQYLRGSASNGYDDACYNLGLNYYRGECGLEQSCNEAIRVLTPAAERGHVPSMELVGNIMCCPECDILTLGASNPNFTKGMHWCRRAAETGDEDAMSRLKGIEKLASGACFMCWTDAPSETSFLRCSRCRAAWYCSKDCQVQHWKAVEGGHKQFCIKWG